MQAEHLRALSPRRFSDVLPKLVRGSSVSYVPNKGNLGDALIAAATAQVFTRLGISDSPSAPVIFVAGGGGLAPYNTCLTRSLRRIPRDRRVIIGPSTVSAHWDLLRSFQNLILMARDDMTMKLAKLNRVACVFSHDAAFEFDYPEVPVTSDHMTVMRGDKEKTSSGSNDISTQEDRWWGLTDSHDSAMNFVTRINAAYVSTNRLHVAIAAACMGRETELLPNSYFKNRAVFETSLSKLPGTKFTP